LVDVLKIIDLTEVSHIERELLLVKVFAQDEATRAAVTRVVDVFQGAILDMGRNTYSLQLVSSTEKIESFLDTLRHESDIVEVVRSGAVGIGRGDKALKA
ncbi:MAG: acetolactate synthase small subunit, partial [Pseudoalteromonas sp.]